VNLHYLFAGLIVVEKLHSLTKLWFVALASRKNRDRLWGFGNPDKPGQVVCDVGGVSFFFCGGKKKTK
jgi:hypothetical protein